MSTQSGPSESIDDVTVVEGSVGGSAAGRDRAPGVTAGSQMGRYVLLEEVGSGGMGVVMAAYDRELDRRVALKLLRPHLSHSGESRMRREAQALAQLQHPAVVTVFEVGKHEGQLFIAMEYVDGDTFDRWVSRHRPPWRRIVEVAIEAGRGLAAAHAVGLVHRDIKPSNILVGKDGRVCVADFGIATATELPRPPTAASLRATPMDGSAVTEATLTPPPVDTQARTGPHDTVEVSNGIAAAISAAVRVQTGPNTEVGTVVGTPAYMSPEQHRGADVDARSDQFALCVALYRVLYDEAPFRGEQLEELRASVAAGRVRPASPGSRVPASVRRVLLRGMAVEPAQRWPSMDALIEALARTLGRRRRWIGAAVVGSLALGVASTLALPPGDASEQVVCPAAQERLQGVWDDTRRVAMRDAFTASTLPYAVDAWTRTEERLDAHAERWAERYDALCERLGGVKEQSRSLDATMACLRQRREELGTLVELLVDGDEATIAKATEAAADLTPVDVCEEQGAEVAQMAMPAAADRPEVDEIRLVLARAEAAYKTGRVGRGMEHARQAHERAQALGYLPLEVEVLYFRGKLEVIDGQLAAAEQDLADAALRAVEARYDRIAVRAATTQAFVVGYQQGRPEEGMKWLRHATAALERLGNDRLLDAELRITRASILTSQGRFEPALVDFRAGLLEREEVLGDGHPTVAASYNNLGSVLVELGRLDEALEALEHARGIWERAYGPRHPVVGTALTGIGAILEQMGRWPEARERLEQALRVREDAFGPDHFNVAITLDNLGSVLARLGETGRARSVIERSLTLRERTLGPRHPHIGSSLVNLGLVAELEGRLDEARDYEERAIALWEETLGAQHPYLTVPLTILGRVELARGNSERARQLLERALAVGQEVDTPSERAETRLALAQVLWEQDPARARTLAERALADVQGPAAGKVALRAQIDRWLADHPL